MHISHAAQNARNSKVSTKHCHLFQASCYSHGGGYATKVITDYHTTMLQQVVLPSRVSYITFYLHSSTYKRGQTQKLRRSRNHRGCRLKTRYQEKGLCSELRALDLRAQSQGQKLLQSLRGLLLHFPQAGLGYRVVLAAEKLDVSIGIIKLQSEVLDLLLKVLYHYVALVEKSLIFSDLILSMAYRLLMLGYYLVSGSNYCLKFLYLSNVPIQLAMSDLCLTSQVDNAAAL